MAILKNKSIYLRVLIALVLFFFIPFKGAGQFISYGGGLNLSNGTMINVEETDYDYFTGSYGIHLKAAYDLDNKLRLVPKIAYFFPKTEDLQEGKATTMLSDLNINLYKINNPDDLLRTYLFGGIHFTGWYIKDKSNNFEREINLEKYGLYPGVSAGAGLKFNIKHDMEFFLEGKYLQHVSIPSETFLGVFSSGQVMAMFGVNMMLD